MFKGSYDAIPLLQVTILNVIAVLISSLATNALSGSFFDYSEPTVIKHLIDTRRYLLEY
jgi:hypothetical protein